MQEVQVRHLLLGSRSCPMVVVAFGRAARFSSQRFTERNMISTESVNSFRLLAGLSNLSQLSESRPSASVFKVTEMILSHGCGWHYCGSAHAKTLHEVVFLDTYEFPRVAVKSPRAWNHARTHETT